MTILTERVASLIEHSATLMRKEKSLENAKEKVRFLNRDTYSMTEKRKLFNIVPQTKHSRQGIHDLILYSFTLIGNLNKALTMNLKCICIV